MYVQRKTHTHVNTDAHKNTHTETHWKYAQADYMQVQMNNLSQRWIFVGSNELTLEYLLYGNIIEYGGQL